MSGPNGDPSISVNDGIINDEDEFDEEGNKTSALIVISATDIIAVTKSKLSRCSNVILNHDLMSGDSDFQLV